MFESDTQPINILLVEDSPTDAELAKKAFRRGNLKNEVAHVPDGIEAIKYLKSEPPYENSPRPDLVLLDLNMPRMDGRETLKCIKDDPELAHIPVIVLTTSSQEADVWSAYESRTNAYIVKPVDLKQFFEVIADLEHFWFQVVTLPKPVLAAKARD